MSVFSTVLMASRQIRRLYNPTMNATFGSQFPRFASDVSIQNRFLESTIKIQLVLAETTTEEKLKVYGLYKQAVNGKNTSKKPSAIDMEAAAKWKAWSQNADMTSEQAKQNYIDFVNGILKRVGKEQV